MRHKADRFLALLACAAACAAGAAPLETLFHTPQERERLDRMRRGEVVAAPSEAAPEKRRELTGFVKRSDGHGTAFIDGVPVPVDPRGAPLLQPDAVRSYSQRKSEDLKIQRKDSR